MTQFPPTESDDIHRLPERDRNEKSWQDAANRFANAYYGPLLAFVRSKLKRGNIPPGLRQKAEDFVQEFLQMEFSEFKVCSQWMPERGSFHTLLRTAVSNFVNSQLGLDSQPGTPEAYDEYRQELEESVRQQLRQQKELPDRLLLAEDYVREFLEYYASRHPRPPRPQEESDPAGGTSGPAGPQDQTTEREAILARLKEECWKFVLDEGRRRRKRPRRESLDGRQDGWEPRDGHAVSPSLAYGRTWAIDLLFEALAAWRGNCQDDETPKRWQRGPSPRDERRPEAQPDGEAPKPWQLVKLRVLEPFYTASERPADKPMPPYEAIFAECGYQTAKQAANAFDTAKKQILRSLREVIRKRAMNPDDVEAGVPGTKAYENLQRRIEEDLEAFQDILDEEYFWHHSHNADGGHPDEVADRGALRRYAERKLKAAGAVDETSDPSMSRGPEDPPDLSQYDLYVIALAFSDEPQPNEQLARQWFEFVSRPWATLFLSGEDAARFAAQAETVGLPAGSSLSDVLRHPQAPVELLKAIREAVQQRRSAAEEKVADRVLNAVEQACIAAALACHGQRITSKADHRLLEHLGWLAKRPWVDEPTRQLARQAVARLTAAAQPT